MAVVKEKRKFNYLVLVLSVTILGTARLHNLRRLAKFPCSFLGVGVIGY